MATADFRGIAVFDAGAGTFGSASRSPIPGSLTLNAPDGVDFGSRTAAPIKFDNFESYGDGTVGDAMSGYISDHSSKPVISTLRKRSGTKAIRWNIPLESTPADMYECFAQFGITLPANTRKIRMAVHWYLEQTHIATNDNYLGEPRQFIRVYKVFRTGGEDRYSGHPQFADTQFCDDDLAANGHDFGMIAENGTNWGGQPGGAGASGGAWRYCEYFCDLGTPGNSDGSFITRVNGVVSLNETGKQMLNADSTASLEWVYLFNGVDYSWDTAYAITADEFLVDHSYRRVVITDNATYASSTKFADQPLTHEDDIWSSPTIAINTPNWSNFAPGSTVYAHVLVDASETPIATFAKVVP